MSPISYLLDRRNLELFGVPFSAHDLSFA